MSVKIDSNLDIWINGRKLWMTLHIRDEMDNYGKDTMFVAKVIDSGKSKLVSKKERRYEAVMPAGPEKWVVVYFLMDSKVLAKHLGKDTDAKR